MRRRRRRKRIIMCVGSGHDSDFPTTSATKLIFATQHDLAHSHMQPPINLSSQVRLKTTLVQNQRTLPNPTFPPQTLSHNSPKNPSTPRRENADQKPRDLFIYSYSYISVTDLGPAHERGTTYDYVQRRKTLQVTNPCSPLRLRGLAPASIYLFACPVPAKNAFIIIDTTVR